MNTKKILVHSSDSELSGIIKISALTLTKLNCQVSIEESFSSENTVTKSKDVNLDLIIIDNDSTNGNTVELISKIRSNINSKQKKIICVHSGSISKEDIFKAGCDSIMTKDEFKKAVNNILVF